jgi:hypothetical protein
MEDGDGEHWFNTPEHFGLGSAGTPTDGDVQMFLDCVTLVERAHVQLSTVVAIVPNAGTYPLRGEQMARSIEIVRGAFTLMPEGGYVANSILKKRARYAEENFSET